MTGKYFNRSRTDPEKKLLVIRSFAAGETETFAARQARVDRRTAYSIFQKVRQRILERARQESETFFESLKTDPRPLIAEHESDLPKPAKGKSQTPFLLCFRNGPAHVEILRFSSGICGLCDTLRDRCGSEALSDCGVIYPIKRFYEADMKEGKYYLEHLPDSFLAFRYFAALHLKKFRGIGSATLLLHMKECQWRYNNRNDEIYPKILELLENDPI